MIDIIYYQIMAMIKEKEGRDTVFIDLD